MRSILLGFLLVTACGKDDKPAETAAAKPAGSPEVAALEAKSLEILDKIVDIFTKDGTNCSKLAVDLEEYVLDNKQAFQQIRDLASKQTASQKQDFGMRNKDRMLQLVTKMGLAMQACGKDPAVTAALKKIKP